MLSRAFRTQVPEEAAFQALDAAEALACHPTEGSTALAARALPRLAVARARILQLRGRHEEALALLEQRLLGEPKVPRPSHAATPDEGGPAPQGPQTPEAQLAAEAGGGAAPGSPQLAKAAMSSVAAEVEGPARRPLMLQARVVAARSAVEVMKQRKKARGDDGVAVAEATAAARRWMRSLIDFRVRCQSRR